MLPKFHQNLPKILADSNSTPSRPLYQTPRQTLQPATTASQNQLQNQPQIRVVQTSQPDQTHQIREVFQAANGTFQLNGQTYQMVSTPNKIIQTSNGGQHLITLQVNNFSTLQKGRL